MEKQEALREKDEARRRLKKVELELSNANLEKQEVLQEKDEARRRMGSYQTFSVKASVEDAPYIGPDRIESRISGSTSLDREGSTTYTRAARSDGGSVQMSSHGGAHLSAAPTAGSFPQSRPNSHTSGPVVWYSVSRTERPNSVPVGKDKKIARQQGTISESPGNGEANQSLTMNRTQAGVGLALVNNGHGAALSMVVRF